LVINKVMVVSPNMSSPQIRCRQIRTADLQAVADLLTRGFPDRPRKYWTTALARLEARGAPEGCPQFGYLLEADGRAAGVLLLIFAEREGRVRCNISSWYVEPAHRGHAAILAAMATKLKHVTYLNTSAATHTWPILEAQGYRRYSQGQFVALPALSRGGGVTARGLAEADRDLPDYELLCAHADAGCTVLVCETPHGPAPFVFLRRRVARGLLPAMQLIYARDTESLAACAGGVGRYLLARGGLCVICDAEAPIAGLAGLFFKDRGPRYFKGPERPRPNDLAFTEMVVFGP
jgi:hypothetical protein